MGTGIRGSIGYNIRGEHMHHDTIIKSMINTGIYVYWDIFRLWDIKMATIEGGFRS